MLTDMNGEPWNRVPPKDKAPQVSGVYITLERQIKHGGTKGCSACFGQATVHSAECGARLQDIVDNEAAQPANQMLRPQHRLRVDPQTSEVDGRHTNPA